MPEETLFWTAAGHLPESALRVEARWTDAPDFVRLDLLYLRGDTLVKNDVHVMAKRGLFGEAVGDLTGSK